MSKFLQQALRASMEAEEASVPVVDLGQVIQENSEIDLVGKTPAELHDQVTSTDNIIEVLEEIGTAAATAVAPEADGTIVNPAPDGPVVESEGTVAPEDGDVSKPADVVAEAATPVSMEALAYSLQTVLRSHGVKVPASSMESGEDQGANVARLAFNTAVRLREHKTVSIESATAAMRSDISSKMGAIAKTKTAMNQAISKINSNAKYIDGSAVELTHRGINDFLHRQGEPVLELKDALKPDIKAMEALKGILKSMGSTYDHLLTTNAAADESDVKKFITGLGLLNQGKLFDGLDGTQLLSNGSINRQDDQEVPYLEISYGEMANDSKGIQKYASVPSGVVTGALAGAALGGPVGALVGGFAGAAIGHGIKFLGNGKNTASSNSAADVVSFLKDAQRMCDLIQGVGDLLSAAHACDTRARQYVKMLMITMKSSNADNMKVVGVNVLTSLLGAVVLHKTGSYNSIGSNKMQTEEQRVGGAMHDLLDANYEGYHSVGYSLIEHVFTCVDGAAKVAQNIIDTIDKADKADKAAK